MKNKRNIRWYAIIVPALLASYAFAFSMAAIWIGDDITYGYSFLDGSKITSLKQVIPSQIAHYETVNGRALAHLLCQLYIPFLGKTFFAISNAIIYICFLLLLANLCQVKYEDWKRMCLLSCLILLGFRTKFTPTCQIGFIWMFALVAAFILILKRFSYHSENRWNSFHLLWATPLAFLSGWSQEALVLGVGAALFIYVLLNFKKISPSQWLLLVSFAAGAAFLCLSPSTINRSGETHAVSNLLPPILFSFAKFGYYLRVSYLLLLFVLYLLLFKKIKIKQLISDAGYYWIVWITLFVFNLVLGVYGNRQLFGMEFAAILIIIRYYIVFIKPGQLGNSSGPNTVLGVLLTCVVCVVFSNVRFLKHQNKLLSIIDTEYRSSDNGIVFYDFSSSDVTFKDTYPSDVFSWYALETMSRSYGGDKKLKVLPTLCAELDNLEKNNCWKSIAPGAIAIIIEKKNKVDGVTVQRSFLKHRISDQTVSLSNPIFENDSTMVFIVYQKLPFVTHDAVLFN